MLNITQKIDNLLEKELLKLVEELKQRHIELGQKASGKWIESLEVVVGNGKGAIYGADHTKYIVHGRPSGVRPPINPLEQWAKDKLGLQGKEALNVAFAVATKIAKEGTKTHRQGGSDVIDSVITDKRMQKMYSEIGQRVGVLIAKDLRR